LIEIWGDYHLDKHTKARVLSDSRRKIARGSAVTVITITFHRPALTGSWNNVSTMTAFA